jgi:putative oxidoreductase
MLQSATKPLAPYAMTVLRVIVGITFVLMGIGKIQNPSGFIGFVTTLGFPAPGVLAWLPIILEPIGGALIILGIATRWLSLYFVIEMLITTFIVKAARGTPFIQVAGKPGTGFELDLLLLAGALVLLVAGSGALSIEHDVLKREL